MTDFQKEMHALSMQSGEFHEMEAKNHQFVQERILAILEQYAPILRVSDKKTAAFLIQSSIEAAVHELVFYECPYDAENIIRELTDMLCRYLLP